MKRLLTALVLALLLTGICVIGVCTIDRQYEKMDGLLEEAIDCYENGEMEKAPALAVEIEKQWVETERYLSLFVNHETVDEVGASIARLEPLALTDDVSDYLAVCKEARLRLLHMRGDEKVDWFNIF